MFGTRQTAIVISLIFVASPAHAQFVRIANAGSIPNGAMTAPTILQSTVPEYTPEALARGIEGVVELQAQADSSGRMRILRVIKGLGFGLDESAISAVREWTFSPALRAGIPVDVI